MNELFGQLFGQQPSYATALLGEEEARRLQQQAQQQGLLNVGLSLLAGSGPSAQPRGIGQLLAQGVQAGQQAYQGAYNKAVQERALMEQLAERRLAMDERARVMREQQLAEQSLPQVFRRPMVQMPDGEVPGAPQLDIGALLSLPLGVQQDRPAVAGPGVLDEDRADREPRPLVVEIVLRRVFFVPLFTLSAKAISRVDSNLSSREISGRFSSFMM